MENDVRQFVEECDGLQVLYSLFRYPLVILMHTSGYTNHVRLLDIRRFYRGIPRGFQGRVSQAALACVPLIVSLIVCSCRR